MANDKEAESEVGVEKEEEEEEKWVKHYSSYHQILLVGDGDFSFSLSLALSFGSASNILASSLDSYDVVIKKYKEAKSNLENLKKLGASLLFGVDATKMKFHTDLKMRKFDRIIYNFPHAGFFGKENNADLIKMHRDLVNGFFRNARGMLRASGEIHVSHKTTGPFCEWNIEELASQNSLTLAACVDFKKEDYPGYNNKRGDGSRCDEPFPLRECSTFKFRLSPKTKMLAPAVHGRSLQFQDIPVPMLQSLSSNNFSYPRAGHFTNMEQVSEDVLLLLTVRRRTHLDSAVDGRSQRFQEIPVPMQQFLSSHNFNDPRAGHLRNMEQVLEDVHLPLTVRRTTHLDSVAHERSQRFQEIPVPMQQFSSSHNFNDPRAGHLTNMEQVLEDVHLPLTVRRTTHLDSVAHERSQRFQEIPVPMQQFSSSHNFNYPRVGHLTNMEQVSEDVHLPLTAGRLQRFQEIPVQMQQLPTSINFSHPRPGYSMNVGQVSEDVRLPLTISARNECFGMIDRRLNNPTEIFGRNMIDSSYPFHAPGLHFRDFAEMAGRTLNGDRYILREIQRRRELRSMQRARLMLDRYGH